MQLQTSTSGHAVLPWGCQNSGSSLLTGSTWPVPVRHDGRISGHDVLLWRFQNSAEQRRLPAHRQHMAGLCTAGCCDLT